MDYVIEKAGAFQVVGYDRVFHFDSSYQNIPRFWDEFCGKFCGNCTGKSEEISAIKDYKIGEFGICIDDIQNSQDFRYMIAGRYSGGKVPEEMKLFEVPELTWAKFKCTGPLPGALQSVNTQVFKQWLPGNPDYEVSAGINIEWYSMGDTSSPDYESEIWIPVRPKN